MKKRILLIEDDSAIIKPLAMALRGEGLELDIAVDGAEALQKLADKDLPDLILLDIVLPKINGFEVLERIKADPKTADIPVIVLSNLAREGEVERGLAAGVKEYLVKTNFSLPDLIVKIKTYL